MKVRGQWAYLYRDFYLSSTRNTAAAKRFLGKALNGLKDWEKPRVINALRKGQASAFNLVRDIRGAARMVTRSFGLGAAVLAEMVQLIGTRLELEAA